MTPHEEPYTATVNTSHTITALPHDDGGETKSDPLAQHPRGRRGGITTLAAEYTINSIAAVRNIVNMILAPMVVVPFLDYCALGKIPRSNTAKPGSTDGPTAKMGSQNSISQPLRDGWTVIFVSVSSALTSL